MFHEDVQGGDFITNMRLPTSGYPPFTDSLLELLAFVKLRDLTLDLLAVFIGFNNYYCYNKTDFIIIITFYFVSDDTISLLWISPRRKFFRK